MTFVLCTVECRYNAVQYCHILHDLLQELRQIINQVLIPNGRAMGCSLQIFVRKLTAL